MINISDEDEASSDELSVSEVESESISSEVDSDEETPKVTLNLAVGLKGFVGRIFQHIFYNYLV